MVTFALCIMIGLAWECNFHGPAIGLFALAVLDRLDRIAEQIKRTRAICARRDEEAVVKDWEAQPHPGKDGVVVTTQSVSAVDPKNWPMVIWGPAQGYALGQSMALAKDKETADLIVTAVNAYHASTGVDQRRGSSTRKQEANHTLPLPDLHLR